MQEISDVIDLFCPSGRSNCYFLGIDEEQRNKPLILAPFCRQAEELIFAKYNNKCGNISC